MPPLSGVKSNLIAYFSTQIPDSLSGTQGCTWSGTHTRRTHTHDQSSPADAAMASYLCFASEGYPQLLNSFRPPAEGRNPDSPLWRVLKPASLGQLRVPQSIRLSPSFANFCGSTGPHLLPPLPCPVASSLLNKELATNPSFGESWSSGELRTLNALEAGKLAFPPGCHPCSIMRLLLFSR